MDRYVQGAREGCLVTLEASGQTVTVLLTARKRFMDGVMERMESDSVGESWEVVDMSSALGKSLRGRITGEEVWVVTGSGLPKPHGRRICVRVLRVNRLTGR